MIEETAVVLQIKDQQALLETQRQSACQSCSVKSGCGTSTLSKVVGQRSNQFVVDNTLNARVGDQVVVAIEERALVQGSLLVYLLPLVFMIMCGLLAEVLFANELASILAAGLGLFAAFALVRRLLSKQGLKQVIQPHLVRIIS